MIPLATIPSPAQGVWHLGPVPLRAYALCILLGIAVAIVIGQRRWKARGGDPVVVMDVATWAVPFGVIGGRLYHVITSPEAYFGANGDPVKAFYIWEGGLGIWGAVLLGAVGAWIGCRRSGVKLPPFGDAIAPGIVIAQAIGRLGNWFNNELYGRATDAPWGLEIYRWDSSAGEAVKDSAGNPVVLGTFQPTFLYESLWDILTAVILIFADRRWKLGHGRVFALYVAVYSLGRGWIEVLRIDEANHILGLRLNVWTSVIVFAGGLIYLVVSASLRPGRETEVMRSPKTKPESTESESDESSEKRTRPEVEDDSKASKDGAGKDGSSKDSKDDASKDSKDDASKDAASKDSSTTVGLSKDGSGSSKDGPDKDGSSKDSPDKNSSNNDSLDKNSSNNDSLDKKSLSKDSSGKDSSSKDAASKDTSDKESSSKDTSSKERPDNDRSSKESSSTDVSDKDSLSKESSSSS
jgi:prolipoprotein diacylglyceryl transferase